MVRYVNRVPDKKTDGVGVSIRWKLSDCPKLWVELLASSVYRRVPRSERDC